MAMDTSETNHGLVLEVTDSKSPERRRQGKFQPFKQLFGRKKKREARKHVHGAKLKASFSTGEVCSGVASDNEESIKDVSESNPIGSRALSHDSIFIPEDQLKEPGLDQNMSQENVSDKVRNLQRQIAQGIRFGQRPPSLRKSEGDDGSSDEEQVLRSPLRVVAQMEPEPPKPEPQICDELVQVQEAQPSGLQSSPVKSPRSKRVPPLTGTIESINLDAVPQSGPRLDNAAAKHKLSVKPKNQRISRKHRRFTLDLQEVSSPGVLQEDLEAGGVFSDELRRASLDSRESLQKQRLYEEEILEMRRRRELEDLKLREEEERRRAEEFRLEEEHRRQQREQERRKEEQEKRLNEEKERWMQQEAEKRRKEEEEKRIREEEETRMREEEEQRRREEAERRKREEEEQRRREQAERRKMEEEEQRRREQAERRKMEEEQRRREEEEKRKRDEEEQRRAEEERRQRDEEEQRRREEEEKIRKVEEERRKREEEQSRLREEEEKRWQEEQKRKENEKRRLEEEKRKQEEAEIKKKRHEEEKKQWLHEIEEKKRLEAEGQRMSSEEGVGDAQERKRRAEELRWKEMEERQRPFSFKVSSGEKQILFQKVNLTPVTPSDPDPSEAARASSLEGIDSPNLPTSPFVPHTAILVTGAQLCGTAVNLDQIKDTACKSLLGLGEDKKSQGSSFSKGKTSPESKSGKTKSFSESMHSTDQSSAAVLAEWACIRSKIFKGVEDGKYDDYPDPPSKTRPPLSNEEESPSSHANLRKTTSASAKFSITPAKKKFGDQNRNLEIVDPHTKEAEAESAESSSPTATSPVPTTKSPNRMSKSVRIVDRGPEECVFAKDLPSFLVPSPGDRPEGSRSKSEPGGQDVEEKPSPFGIKLRRTNYSLRFHSEQSTEKRKKRYSAGDNFDGVPSPLTPIEPDSDASSVFSDKSSPTSPQRESVLGKYLHSSASPAVTRGKFGKPSSPTIHHEGEKVLPVSQVYRRPATSPKPSGATPTPPSSPLPKALHGLSCEESIQARRGSKSDVQEPGNRTEELPAVHSHQSSHSQAQEEEESKEKRSFFPSINIPWREKADRKTELIRREKPSLQTRHSLDSAKVQEKEGGPLWITLALQKQKGFREQQQCREERKSQREAKLAEKQAREKDCVPLVSPTECKGAMTGSSSKAHSPEEPKRPDSLLGRFERRDNLKKANTLPSSVTVEISDSTPSPPSVKDVSKRFPSSDSPQVSTEPAWLALAKRKAKAWSDCPQIIK